MLYMIYGKSGTGKTERIFAEMEKAAAEGTVYLLVPDREAVMAESRAATLRGAGSIEVLTFTRLCNTLFRRYGGLSSRFIGKGAKKLLMRGVMRGLAPMLHEYGKAQGFGMYEKLTAMRTTLYQDGILPRDLDRASMSVGLETPLGAKLSDLSLLFAAFDAELSVRFEDPDGVLSRASKLLETEAFFRGSTVFIDSFTSFSAQQAELLTFVMRDAKDVFVTLPYLPEEREEPSVRFLAGTDERLRRAARRAGNGEIRSVTLRGAKRYESDALAFLSTEISSQSGNVARFEGGTGDLRLVRGANLFAEAEAAACDILRAVRSGLRFREIAVILRDTAMYEGVLDAVFRKYEIPYFLSSRSEIAEKPLVKLIFSAFSVIDRGFRGEDVITYIKTGFAGISPDDASLLENYIVKWNLRGKLFTNEEPWTMHPRGYGFSFSDEDGETLMRLASLRETVVSPLMRFSSANKTAKIVREKATVLFDFLTSLGVYDKLSSLAEEAEAAGERALAMETVQLWNALCETLDTLVTCAGESETDAGEFSSMLMMLFLETDIGKIPTSVDEVVISGASETLAGTREYVYLIGAAEGVFPQRVTEEGLFSEHEKRLLADCDVELSDRLEKRVSEELYYFYRAASAGRKRLYISYPHYSLSGAEQRESVGLKRVKALFPDLKVEDHELSRPEELIEGKNASFEYAMSLGGNLGRALREYYESDGGYAEKLRYIQMPLGAEKTVLSPENAEALFPGKLSTSYSRLEKFIKCRFAYFCEYEMRLSDDSPAKFGAVDIGSFMHGVLEKTVEKLAGGDNVDIRESVRSVAADYIMSLFGRAPENLPKRLSHLFDYLCKSAEVFARRMEEEFRASSFRPCDFELTVGRDGDGVLPMTLVGEDVSVELRGKIDRVDMYEGEGGKCYIRVVDYKTGDKTFDLKNVRLGLDMQMLLYLFSVWENGGARYGGEIVPAGVLYAGIKPPRVDVAAGEVGKEETITVKTSGLFLHDEALLRAMEPTLEGRFIPVKEKDIGREKPNLVGLDAFCELKNEVRATVLKYAAELKHGRAEARPLTAGGQSPCEYCRMRSLCRIR